MKTNKVKNKNYKLFKYNLLKLQVYSTKPSSDTVDFSNQILEQIQVYLKHFKRMSKKHIQVMMNS